MSTENIVARIISDAEQEAAGIIARAENGAEAMLADAKERVRRMNRGTEAEVEARAKAITDGRAATARLDCAKVFLAGKRQVIDSVYSHALEKLLALDEKQTLKLAESLLNTYAEKGDEIIFAQNFKYAEGVKKLKAVAEKGLKVSAKRLELSGGFILSGTRCDKDLSYSALLASDREVHEAELAAKLFKQ